MAATTTRNRKKAAPARKKAVVVTDEHKAAMAQGRQESAQIRKYLAVLKEANAPRTRGRKRTPESIKARLDKIAAELTLDIEPLREVKLIQEQIDLQAELETFEAPRPDPAEFEDAFIKAAASYSARQGITHAAWRQLGVPALVLRKAQVPR